jgi:hypothetical protein
MASLKKEVHRLIRQMAQAAADNPEMLSELLDAMVEHIEEPASPTIERFIEEEGDLFTRELSFLARFEPPAPRIIPYVRVFNEGKKERSPWKSADILYMAPEFFVNGIEDLQGALDAAVEDIDEEETLSIWLAPFQDSDERTGFLLYMRDQDGREALCRAKGGDLSRMPVRAERLPEMFSQILEPHLKRGLKPLVRIEKALVESGQLEELLEELKNSGCATIEADQWKVLAKWVAHSDAVRFELVRYAQMHASNWSEEAHGLMRIAAHTLSDFFEHAKEQHRKLLGEIEKAHDKKLTRLRGDLEKMRMLSDGVKKRADRSDSDNRALQKRLKTVQAQQGAVASTGESDGSAAANEEASLGQALDTLFG